MERLDTDILILGAGGAGLFAALHALQADPSRAMESVGKVFEPQLNLGIEF